MPNPDHWLKRLVGVHGCGRCGVNVPIGRIIVNTKTMEMEFKKLKSEALKAGKP